MPRITICNLVCQSWVEGARSVTAKAGLCLPGDPDPPWAQQWTARLRPRSLCWRFMCEELAQMREGFLHSYSGPSGPTLWRLKVTVGALRQGQEREAEHSTTPPLPPQHSLLWFHLPNLTQFTPVLRLGPARNSTRHR